MFDPTAALPEQVDAAARGARSPRGAHGRGSRRGGHRHGRQRHGGDVVAAVSPLDARRAGAGGQVATSARRLSARTRWSSRCRPPETPRRRCRRPPTPQWPAPGWSSITAGGSWRSWPRCGGAPGWRFPGDIPQPRAALGAMAMPAPGGPRGDGPVPGRPLLDRRRRRPAQTAPGRVGQRPGPSAAGRRSPAASGARSRSSMVAGPSGRRRPTLEDADQRERQGARPSGAPSPSCATTRSAGGGSTVTSPAR